jgi:phenylpropionate dioxygenase-like ring-hydroxylating dioxygenase large terminal subunit
MADVAEKLDPEILPEYVPSAVLEGEAREEAVRMMLRRAEHVRNKTTDQAEGTWQEPVENYADEELFRAEVETLFKRIPLPLALSCELPGKNSYKAIEAVGLPVVITRDATGEVHAMLNVCRHRGALICAEGTGTSRALTCPYHAWSYGMDGELRGIYGESTFGDVDRSERSLVQLPVVEVAGLIFVCLTPGLEMDIDGWLGDFKPVLEGLKLDELHLFSSRMMPGPNWKVVIEGYLEGYHFASLHPNTVFKTNLSNTGIFDGFGPHERVGFALRNLENEINAGADVQDLDPSANVGAIIWLFPGMSFAGAFRERMTCSLVLPTTSVDASVTEQRVFTRRPVTDENREDLEVFRDFFYDVTYGEDYITGYGVQKGVKAVPGTTQLYGRNEPGVQYAHQTINRIMKENHVEGMALPREA